MKKKYATKEERLAARRDRYRARQAQGGDRLSQPEIKIRASAVVERWKALQQQHDLETDTAVATFLLNR